MPLAPALKSHVHQREVELSALAAATLGDLKREDAAAIVKRLRIGIARDFSQVVEVNAQTVPSSSWTVLPDGSRIWTIHIISRGAIGLRVHLENVSLNSRARLIIYNPSNAPVTATLVPRRSKRWAMARPIPSVPPRISAMGSAAIAGTQVLMIIFGGDIAPICSRRASMSSAPQCSTMRPFSVSSMSTPVIVNARPRGAIPKKAAPV